MKSTPGTRELLLLLLVLLAVAAGAQTRTAVQDSSLRWREAQPERYVNPSRFPWPQDAKMALSLSFDDGWDSQVDYAVPLLDSFAVKATFYVLPERVAEKVEAWRRALAAGHELGNHTARHPCTGNFAWTRYDGVALEDYDLAGIRREMEEANTQLEQLLGVRPTAFAYPCGETYVGRGAQTSSYVPLVAELFHHGRRWASETANAPYYVDRAQIMAMRMDNEPFTRMEGLIQRTKRNEDWLVLAGHGVGDNPGWGTDLQMLRQLLAYATDPANQIWVAPVGEVAAYIEAHRSQAGAR